MVAKQYIGLRNTCLNVAEDKWYYLLFYEIDDREKEGLVRSILNDRRLTYFVYETKHGIHFIGLEPMLPVKWGYMKLNLDNLVGTKFTGQTIRLSLKTDEQQKFIALVGDMNDVIPNLYNIYARRFNLSTIALDDKYKLVFEKYWSKGN